MLPSLKSTTGFVQITMGGEDAVRMMEILDADIIVPMHFESCTHFTQDRKALEEAFTSEGLEDKIKWLSSRKEVNVIWAFEGSRKFIFIRHETGSSRHGKQDSMESKEYLHFILSEHLSHLS